jgi:hypothetical protein
MDAARVEVVHRQTVLVGAENDQRVGKLRVVGTRALEEESLALEPLELGGPMDDRGREHRMPCLDLPRADNGVERLELRVDWHLRLQRYVQRDPDMVDEPGSGQDGTSAVVYAPRS